MSTFNYNSGSFSGSLDETDIKLWLNEFPEHDNMSGFIENIILNKNNQLFKRMQSEWVPKLINDSTVFDLPDLLDKNDVLVLNNTQNHC